MRVDYLPNKGDTLEPKELATGNGGVKQFLQFGYEFENILASHSSIT